ncbi:bromodomain-containing protein 4-like [Macrobrachium nipponense]|uniref:bromodomain-containing protein 4-like n=1 Tax=Macrobrachium nipponense TaxID=159736 RepID=UPI0030C8555A
MSQEITEHRETVTTTDKTQEEEDETEAATKDADKVDAQEEVVEGRSHHRGGVSRRGHLKGQHLSRPKVIITANNRAGQKLDDTVAMDRNLPPPRLPETSGAQGPPQSTYRVNYPGAKLRVGAPRPSHLTQGAVVISARRDTPPQSINFGSSSYSTGAFHMPRDPAAHEYHPNEPSSSHNIPTGPVTYYSPSHPQDTPTDSEPQKQKPRFQFPVERPQPPNYADPLHHDFKPSKLLPPITKGPLINTQSSTQNLPSNELSRPQPPPPRPPPQLMVPIRRKNNRNEEKHAEHSESPRPPYSYSSPPTPPRKGQVVNAPRPALMGILLDPAGDSTASLATLGTISKSGVRPEIDHRAGAPGRHDSSAEQNLWPPPQTNPERQPGTGYEKQDDRPYTFVSGEVYTPPPIVKRPFTRSTKHSNIRITTRRPGSNLPIIPFEEKASTYVPRYVKEAIAEVEFESKTFDAPEQPPPMYHPQPNWFLMPVQGWFVLSIILAALLIVLLVVTGILYKSLRKQKKKVGKIMASGLALASCIDPVNHELCQCRTLSPLVRTQTMMSRASVMSRASQRTLRPGSRRHGIINYDNDAQQRTTGFRSLPNPALTDKEKDFDSMTTTHTQIEVDDTPPPLAPKKSSLNSSAVGGGGGGGGGGGHEGRSGGGQDFKKNEDSKMATGNGRDSRASNQEVRCLSIMRDSRQALPEARSSSSLGGYYGGKGTSTQHQRTTYHTSDVQLTTIYPPPRRFEL